GELDAGGDGGEQRRDQDQDDAGDDVVAYALDEAVEAIEGRLAHRDHRQVADRVDARLDQVEDEDVRNEVDRSGGVAQLFEHLEDARLRGHRQRDVDDL